MMANNHSQRIMKNTVMLYLRTAVMVFIGLYTSRVVLHALGNVDFGILSVVGGLAVVFSFLSNAINVSTQRYVTVAVGKGEGEETKRVFTASVNCNLVFALVVLLLSETVGLWFLNTQLEIPADRMWAAHWVFQSGLAVLLMSIMNEPYLAYIKAAERMDYYALSCIAESLLKLGAVLLVAHYTADRLSVYACLLFAVSLVKFIADRCYCHISFADCRYLWRQKTGLHREIFRFSGWNLLKTASVIGVNQGNNFVTNILGGGPVANAALGLANQVYVQVYNFTTNVLIAFNPQITRTCSTRELDSCYRLVTSASKASVLMFLLIAIPMVMNMDYVLQLWLGEYPEGTAALCIVCLISCFVDAMFGSLETAIMAHGKIRRYQIVTSILWCMAIPVAIVALYMGLPLYTVVLAKVVSQVAVMLYALWELRGMICFPIRMFADHAVIRLSLLFAIVPLLSLWLTDTLIGGEGFVKLCLTTLISTLLLVGLAWIGVLNREERSQLLTMVNNRLKR